METAISTLSVLPTTKSEIEVFSNKLINELESGYVNPLELLRYQKCIEKVFDKVKETLTKLAREEAEKHGAKQFEFKGVKMELAEVGTKYDYSNCNDFVLGQLTESVNTFSEMKKQRETMLKAIKEPMNLISDDGEPYTVYPPTKTSTSSIKVTV
jgi:hypothetical protein